MQNHKCKEVDYCICSPLNYDPDDYCPIHGGCKKQPRCIICGRFITKKEKKDEKSI